MERVTFNGWRDCVRLANRNVELIVTTGVGPRVIRFGFIGERNLFAEIKGQQGGAGETKWMIRGGHRFWIAPEEFPRTYELDNTPIRCVAIPNGVAATQETGPLSGIQKKMRITLDSRRNAVTVMHTLTNRGRKAVRLAPWALSVMAPGGMAVIPLPGRIPHTSRLTHNQEWSLWGYTDFTDGRWTVGSRYLFFRQNRKLGPNKLGIAHREGWVGYQLDGFLFVKRFEFKEGATYPDGGVNFETFSNEDFLELESLGPLDMLRPGASVTHTEQWELHRGIRTCRTEKDADKLVAPVVERRG